MQLSRKRTIVPDHLSSSSSNHQPQRRCPRQTIQSPDKNFQEEHLHLLQHSRACCSPSEETDVVNSSTTTPLLWHQPRLRLPLSGRTDKSWSMSSLFECCPMSPSPVCSPFISHVSNAHSHVSNARSHVSHVNTDDAMFPTAKVLSSLSLYVLFQIWIVIISLLKLKKTMNLDILPFFFFMYCIYLKIKQGKL